MLKCLNQLSNAYHRSLAAAVCVLIKIIHTLQHFSVKPFISMLRKDCKSVAQNKSSGYVYAMSWP